MFEDMLAYHPGTYLNQPFAELLAADLDDDAQQFYLRAAADLTALAAAGRRPGLGAEAALTLLKALVAAPGVGGPFWRQFYRQLSLLIADAPQTAPSELEGPLSRLGQFLSENVDIGDAIAIEELERSVFRGSAGA